MGIKKGSSLLEVRRSNRVLLKNTIFQLGPITRTEIADRLGLTLPTITTSVNEMLKEGILEELPLAENQLMNSMGRRPQAIAFCAGAACALGVELGPYATTVVLMNIKGEVLAWSVEKKADENYQVMLKELSALLREYIGKAESRNLVGVGIGLPGFIESNKGIIRSNLRKDWNGRHLTEDLEKELGLSVIIDNNVRVRAVGYEMSYHGYRPDTFAYFYISKGIACPLMIKDDVLSGYTAGAGELGHTIISVWDKDSGEGMVQKCVDDLAGESVIIEKCKEKLEKGGAVELKKLLGEEELVDIKQVLRAQELKDGDVCQILQEAIEFLGIALANVVNLINPGFVVVDGYVMRAEENRKQLLRVAKSKFFGLNEEEVKLIFQPFDYQFGAKGAAFSVIRRLFLEK